MYEIRQADNSLYQNSLKATGGLRMASAILAKRGVQNPEDFLCGDVASLSSPYVFVDMEKTAAFVGQALKERPNEFVLHSDYDCDGLTSCYIFANFVRDQFGFTPATYVNHREKEGYGLTVPVVEKLYAKGYRFILTADNGIASVEAAERAEELGMDLVITDHHEPKEDIDFSQILPKAKFILNHKIKNSTRETIDLCGAGTLFFLCRAINDKVAMKYIDAAGMATVVDMVSMADKNNRIMVKESLRRLNDKIYSSFTFETLITSIVKSETLIDEETFGFTIGPVINAAGRLSKAQEFKEVYVSSDAQHESFLFFVELNQKRKDLTAYYFKKIDSIGRSQVENGARFITIVAKGMPEGLVGLIAGKLESAYLLPSFVFTVDENGNFKGSGRSRTLDLRKIFTHEHSGIIKGGGHTGACGVHLEKGNMEYFKNVVESMEFGKATLLVDGKFTPSQFTAELVHELRHIAPYGQGFPKPIFASDISEAQTQMIKQKHASCTVDGCGFIMFNATTDGKEIKLGHVIGTIGLNTYGGVTKPQFIVDRILTA